MKAIGYLESLEITDSQSLQAFDLAEPSLGPRDLLVEVEAISVNPVDVKVRMRAKAENGPKVLGYDASGVVRSVGAEVTLFRPGDAVFYAGAIDRQGTNSERHAVDERIVGRKPASLSHADAAALPLTAITAWELLFDRFAIAEGSGAGETLLVVGGAGGVGSILVQLARKLTKLTVVATASRPETRAWVEKMGAHHIVDHRADMVEAMAELGAQPSYIAGLTATDRHFPAYAQMLAPQGKIGLIDDPDPKTVDISLIKPKAASLHWEFMFARSLFQTDDMIEQHRLLNRVADLVDEGVLRTTANQDGGKLSAETLRKAHALQESGAAIGKTTLTW